MALMILTSQNHQKYLALFQFRASWLSEGHSEMGDPQNGH